MKILLINKFLHANGGSETYVFRLGRTLQRHGHEVQYFGMEHEGRCVGNAAEAYTSQMDFHEGSMLSKLTYPVKTIYSKEAREKLRAVLNNFKPDVCHLNNFNYQLTPSIILEIRSWEKKNGKRVRIIYTAHDYQLICPNHMVRNSSGNCEKCIGGSYGNCVKERCIHGSRAKSMIGAMEGAYWRKRAVYKEIDTVICCSEFMKSKMDLEEIFRGKTIAMHNFVDRPKETGSPKETDTPNETGEPVMKKDYVLYFGRYSEEKGVRTLIEAAKNLPHIPFVFAGSGPLEAELSGVSNITNAGFLSGEALKKVIREAKFSVYPSEWYENCPFSVMESQMYKTPVLGANIGGIPELIVSDAPCGELFESKNTKELTEKIQKLWNDCSTYTKNCETVSFDDADAYYEKLIPIYKGRLL